MPLLTYYGGFFNLVQQIEWNLESPDPPETGALGTKHSQWVMKARMESWAIEQIHRVSSVGTPVSPEAS